MPFFIGEMDLCFLSKTLEGRLTLPSTGRARSMFTESIPAALPKTSPSFCLHSYKWSLELKKHQGHEYFEEVFKGL